MNLKQFETNIENVKKQTPEIYKKSMLSSVPFFILHKKIYEEGETLILKECNINQSELDVLASLYYVSDGSYTLSPTQLYDIMLFSSGGMTKLLKKLETNEFIERVENKEDKRSKLVKITTKGISITIKALTGIISLEDEYFSKLDDQEQELFIKLIYKMLNEIKANNVK